MDQIECEVQYDNMFYIPILKIQCKDWENKKAQLIRISENLKFTNYQLKTDFFDDSVKNISTISEIFSDEIAIAQNKFGFTHSKITHSWFEEALFGGQHKPHTHSNKGYSAVCYLMFDFLNHKPTTFIAPFHNFLDGEALEYTPEVKEGTIIFFPSSILHFSNVNLSEQPRKVVSFNITFN